ncbi:Reverse transcriptase domain-containing protein, partial [Aphis craccivora]
MFNILTLAIFLGFVPCINNFTRSVNNSNSFIDHILTKNVEISDISSYIIKCNITYHYATALFIKNNSSIKDYIDYLPKTKYKIDFIYLNMFIKIENWDTYLNSTSIDESFDKFNLKISEFINLSSNWITNGLINKITNAGNDVKKLWNIIKEISGKKTYIFTINQIRDNSVAQSISYPLSYLFNLAISLGTFLNNLKKCVILPLYIKQVILKIYLIIVQLSLTISKIFEKCIKYRILQFLNKNNFFSKNQFGFLN